MQIVGESISWVVSKVSIFTCILLVGLVAHVTLDVVMRYLFNQPLGATILYVSAYYMVAIVFLPIALVEENGNHIAVDLFTGRLPKKIQSILLFIATIVTVVVTVTLAIRTGQEALTKYNVGSFSIEGDHKIIIWPSYFFLPIGFGMMSVVASWKAIAIAIGKDSGLRVLTVEDPYLTGDPNND